MQTASSAIDANAYAQRRPAFIQVAVFGISAALLLWSVAGLIANPDFATGAAATSKRVLGVEFNGWHAVSGFLLFAPGLVFALKRSWAQLFAIAAAGALFASGALILLDSSPAGLVDFRHNGADAVLHFASGIAYATVALIEWARARPT